MRPLTSCFDDPGGAQLVDQCVHLRLRYADPRGEIAAMNLHRACVERAGRPYQQLI